MKFQLNVAIFCTLLCTLLPIAQVQSQILEQDCKIHEETAEECKFIAYFNQGSLVVMALPGINEESFFWPENVSWEDCFANVRRASVVLHSDQSGWMDSATKRASVQNGNRAELLETPNTFRGLLAVELECGNPVQNVVAWINPNLISTGFGSGSTFVVNDDNTMTVGHLKPAKISNHSIGGLLYEANMNMIQGFGAGGVMPWNVEYCSIQSNSTGWNEDSTVRAKPRTDEYGNVSIKFESGVPTGEQMTLVCYTYPENLDDNHEGQWFWDKNGTEAGPGIQFITGEGSFFMKN